MKNIFLSLVFLIIFPSISLAQTPPTLNLQEYKYCNSYQFNFVMLKIYDVYLCNNKSENLPLETLYDNDFALVINYDKNIKSKDLVDTSIKEIKKNHQLSAEQQKNYHQLLSNIFPNVKPRDVIIASFFAANGKTKFSYNSKFGGEIADKDFSKKFLDIWLGRNASYPEMRNQLLERKK